MAVDPLPPDAPLARRVTTGLAKVGLAIKQQAWAEAGGRGLTPTQGQALACSGPAPVACAWASWPVGRTTTDPVVRGILVVTMAVMVVGVLALATFQEIPDIGASWTIVAVYGGQEVYRLFVPVQQAALQLARRLLPQAGRVLDVGCGTGRLLRSARQCYPAAELVGVDLAGRMPAELAAVLATRRLEVIGAEPTRWFGLPDVQVLAASRA